MTPEQDQFFTKIYKERRKSLLIYAENRLGDYAMAEDAVQQAFEIGWRKIEDFQNSPYPPGWILKATNFVVNNMKSRQRTEHRVIAIMEDYRPDLVAAPADHLPLRVHFGELLDTPQFRIIYEMEIQGRTLAEIAKDLGISETACKKRAERARKNLQKKLR